TTIRAPSLEERREKGYVSCGHAHGYTAYADLSYALVWVSKKVLFNRGGFETFFDQHPGTIDCLLCRVLFDRCLSFPFRRLPL
ncbi:MAG: hypothetical protein ACPGYL_07395, partial [Rhodospirillaceae bacterium]